MNKTKNWATTYITNNTNILNELKEELQASNDELNKPLKKKMDGIILRSKATIIEYSDENSKYFANLEKRNAEKKIMSQLVKHLLYTIEIS